jgi:hypothetical protein
MNSVQLIGLLTRDPDADRPDGVTKERLDDVIWSGSAKLRLARRIRQRRAATGPGSPPTAPGRLGTNHIVGERKDSRRGLWN